MGEQHSFRGLSRFSVTTLGMIFVALAIGAIFVFPQRSLAAQFQVDSSGTLMTNLVSYWRMESSSNDFYGSNNGADTGMLYGTQYGLVNKGAGFKNSPSYVYISSQSGIPTGTSARSVAVWVNTTSTNGSIFLFQEGNNAIGQAFAPAIVSGKDYFSGYAADVTTGTKTLNDGNWHLFIVTYDGTTVKLYVDNVFDVSGTPSLNTAGATVYMGIQVGGGNYLIGNEDEIGVWSKVLSTQEMTDLWNSGAGQTMVGTPSTKFQVDSGGTLTNGLQEYYKLEDTSDYWSSHNFTNYGSTTFNAGKVNNAADLGASNTTKYLVNSDNLGIAGGTISLAAWVNVTTAPATNGYQAIFSNSDASDGIFYSLYYYDVSGTKHIGFDRGLNGNSENIVNSATTLTTGTWYFLVGTYDGTNLNLYLNGTSTAGPTSGGSGSGCCMTSNTDVGTYGSPGGFIFSGKVDEAGVWNRVLTTQEISDLYNGGSGNTLVKGPSLLGLQQYKFDATTTIPAGDITTESTAVLGAKLYSTTSSTVQLQIEVEPASTSFTGIPNATSSFVSSGSFATTTFASSTAIDPSVYPRDPESWSNGQFHWQARVIDSDGATSTWNMFGSSASSTDFVIKTVPLYTQETSTYPSAASSGIWAAELYDNGLPGTQCGTGANSSTIAACGCAITSVAMWMRYYGITTNASGTDVNPGTLNDWLENNGGYTSTSTGGVLYWPAIEHYASSSSGGNIVYDVNGTSSMINSLLASSTPDPVILYEANAPDGSATTTHFVVAIASSTNAGTSTYAIRDSYWYNTRYLNQPTSTGPSTVNFYNNEIDGVDIYYDPPQPSVVNEYVVNEPNALILVDSQGRRTGKDPITGILYHEIPNTSYKEEAVNPGHFNGELFVSNLPDGQYTLYVLGGKTGSYYVDAWFDDWQHLPETQSISGDVQVGSMVAYAQSYNTANSANSTFAFESAASSTASITSAPPNNLPPPPVAILSPQSVSTPIVYPATPSSTPTSSTPILETTSSLLTNASSTGSSTSQGL